MKLYLLEELSAQVQGHKWATFYGTLSCVPFKHSPWPCYLVKPTIPSFEEWDVEHLHNTNNVQRKQQPQVRSTRKPLAQN